VRPAPNDMGDLAVAGFKARSFHGLQCPQDSGSKDGRC